MPFLTRSLVLFSCLGLVGGAAAQTQLGTLRLAPTSLQFTGIAGGGSTPPQTLYVVNDTTFQSNITGQWSGSSFSSLFGGAAMGLQAAFTQNGSSFTGTVTPAENPAPIAIAGTIVGSSFTFGSTGQGGSLTGQGTLSANTIAGSFLALQPNGQVDDMGTFTLTRQGPSPALITTLNWTAQASVLSGASGWLQIQPASGSSTAGSGQFTAISVSVQTSGLAADQYSGLITVTSSGAANSPVAVPVLLTVLAANSAVVPQVRPSGLVFVGAAPTVAPQTVQVSTASSSTVQVTTSTTLQNGAGWLSVTPNGAPLGNTTPVNLSVNATAGGLAPGVYRGQVNLAYSDGSSPQIVPVVLIVPASAATPASISPAATCGPAALLAVDRTVGSNFVSQVAWPTTLEALVADDCGNLSNNAVVVASFSSGDPSLTLQALGNGIFQATWRPVLVASNITVTLTATQNPLKQAQVALGGKVKDNPNVPQIFAGGLVSAASYAGAAIPPGGIVSIFGKNLAQAGAASTTPLPTQLGGLKLSVAGRDLPLFYTSAGQVNAQWPAELNTGTTVAVVAATTVGAHTVLAAPEVVTVGPTAPGIFSVNQDGKGQGVILDASNRLLDGKQASATGGQVVVIYCTGLGPTAPLVASGQVAPTSPLAQVDPLPAVTIGGLSSTVGFAGLTPGLVGLYQINVTVPAGVTGTAVPVVINHKGISSNTVTMVIR